MLLHHTALYTMARGAPGIFNFLAIILYTRFLNPEAYGLYAVVIAAVGLCDSILFHWLRSGLLRFLPAHAQHPEALLSTLFIGFLGMVAFTAVVGIALFSVIPNPALHGLFAIAVVLSWASAWFQLNLELVRCQLAPIRYGFIATFKTVLALVIGIVLVLFGYGVYGPLLGLLIGMLVSSLALALREWRNVQMAEVDWQLFSSLLRYGLPLTGIFALTFVISSSDRFLLAWFLGSDAAGLYAPAYDLAQHSLGLVMMVVNLAAYPLAVHALEQQGDKAARQQLRKNGLLLLAIAVPSATGLAMCSTNIANLVLGEAYRETAAVIIPWVALAALIAGIKSYVLDLAFQLGYYTMGQFWVVLIAAGVNVALNFYWIPKFGLLGAAYATVVAYIVGLYFSWLLGRRVFRLPALHIEFFKIILASAIMAVVLWFTLSFQGWLALLGQIVLGGGVYVLLLLVFNLTGTRQMFSRLWGLHLTGVN